MPWPPVPPPALSVADNVKTVALIEAGYLSMTEARTSRPIWPGMLWQAGRIAVGAVRGRPDRVRQ